MVIFVCSSYVDSSGLFHFISQERSNVYTFQLFVESMNDLSSGKESAGKEEVQVFLGVSKKV